MEKTVSNGTEPEATPDTIVPASGPRLRGRGRGECSCLDVTPGWFDDYQGMPPIPMATGGSALAVGGVASGAVPLTQAMANIILTSHCQPDL